MRRAGAEAAAEEAEQAKAAGFRARRENGQRTGAAPAAAAVELAQEKLDRAVAAQQGRCDDWDERNAAKIAATGTGLSGPRPAGPENYVRVRQAQAHLDKVRARAAARQEKKEQAQQGRPAPVRNITDPDSRLMPVRGGGFIQGYNAQNVTSEDGLIIATELTQDTTDTAWFEPMLAAAQDAAALITARHPRTPATTTKTVTATTRTARTATTTASQPGTCPPPKTAAPAATTARSGCS